MSLASIPGPSDPRSHGGSRAGGVPLWQVAAKIAPGLALTCALAGAAFALRAIPGLGGLSPMILAIVLGMILHNIVGTPAKAREGVVFSMRRVLRAAIILLGLQLTIAQIIEVGPVGLAIIVTTMIATFAFTTWMGRRLGVDRNLTELIAAGTSICGASAVIATNTVTRAPEEDVAYAVASVTVFGSIAMLSYPLLGPVLQLDAHDFGLWAGASIHEIAQVVAATFQVSPQTGEFGTIAKLSRVVLLAPMILVIGLIAARRQSGTEHGRSSGRPPMPLFVLGFLGLAILNSFVTIPDAAKATIATLTAFLLSVALAAMGLETDIRKLAAKGARPAVLALLAFCFIAGFSLTLIKLAG